MCWYCGMRGKCRHADAGNGTCTGTDPSQCRPFNSASVQHFWGTCMLSFCGTYISLWGDEAAVPARRHQQWYVHRHVFQSTSTANWYTGTAFLRYIIVSFCGTYVALCRDEGQVPARRRQQRDMLLYVFQSTSTSNCCTGAALLRYIYASFCGTCVSRWRDAGQTPGRRRQQWDTHRHVFQSSSTAN